MKRLSNARSLTAISVMAILLCAVVPAMATSYPYSGTYNVSGSLDNQYFGGSIVWTGNEDHELQPELRRPELLLQLEEWALWTFPEVIQVRWIECPIGWVLWSEQLTLHSYHER